VVLLLELPVSGWALPLLTLLLLYQYFTMYMHEKLVV
jgi:hypothetical protein